MSLVESLNFEEFVVFVVPRSYKRNHAFRTTIWDFHNKVRFFSKEKKRKKEISKKNFHIFLTWFTWSSTQRLLWFWRIDCPLFLFLGLNECSISSFSPLIWFTGLLEIRIGSIEGLRSVSSIGIDKSSATFLTFRFSSDVDFLIYSRLEETKRIQCRIKMCHYNRSKIPVVNISSFNVTRVIFRLTFSNMKNFRSKLSLEKKKDGQ